MTPAALPQPAESAARPPPTVTLAHGAGGKAMRDLVHDVFVTAFDNPLLAGLEDQARVALSDLNRHGDRLAFTTDSYVVDPLFFPGGDIGKLAVCGTVNDLAVGGAMPLHISCAVVIEEGFEIELLRRAARSMADAARDAGVTIVTGDTKVVNRGACDKLFVTTSGIGVIPAGRRLGADQARPGDCVLVTGTIGDHGAAILAARGEFSFETPVASDCAALHGLIAALLAAAPGTRFLRDATRGGAAVVLNELAEASAVGIELSEAQLPIRRDVRGLAELLGLDPLYLANEGMLVAVIPAGEAEAGLAALRAHPLGCNAAIVGRVIGGRLIDGPAGRVVMRTVFGGRRIVDMPIGEQLPRIC